MNRTAALLALTVAAAGISAPAALSAPKKKTITKTYTINVPAPDPTNYADRDYSVCAQNVPQSFHVEPFKVPAAGTLDVVLSGFTGDMDLLLVDVEKQELAYGGASEITGSEQVTVKFKKPTTAYIIGCNWASGPTGTIKYVFTYK